MFKKMSSINWRAMVMCILLVCIIANSAFAAVDHFEITPGSTTTVPGVPVLITTKAFDAGNNPIIAFSITYSIVEPGNSGTLDSPEDCDGEPAGSLHCVKYNPPDVDGTFHVRAVLDSDPSISIEAEIKVVHCAPYPADGGDLSCTGPIVSPPFDHKADLKLAVILLEPQDFLSQDDAERQQFRDLITDRFFGNSNSVKKWFEENAIGESRLVGDANDVYGPYELTHNWGEYFQPDGQIRWGDGQGICFQIEGAALADPDLDYTNYNRIFFIVKGDSSHNVWGWTNAIWNKQMSEGCIMVSSARAGSESDWKVCAHEFMHTLLMTRGMSWTPDLYLGADPRKVDGWDIMDNHTRGSQNTIPIKYCGEWLQNEVYELPRPTGNNEVDETITISPTEIIENDPNVFKTIMIPITDRKTFFVEARITIAGNTSDQDLPADGVIITEWIPVPSAVNEDRAQVLLMGGPLTTVGDRYEDIDPLNPANYLTIELVGINSNKYTLRVRWKQKFGPDPYIIPWDPPPYESVDIWNDSPLNNVGGNIIYEDADSGGNPQGRGDQPSFDVTNTFYARIHNGGNEDVDNVQVLFYWLDPNIGAEDWNYIDFDQVNIPANGEAIAKVEWVPDREPAHICGTVIINVVPGELNPNNNFAQENFHVQESPGGSPYTPAAMTVNVSNPFDHPTFVLLGFHNLERDWKIHLSKSFVRLQPGETKPVVVTVTPPDYIQDKHVESLVSVTGFAYRQIKQNFEQMVHLGGVSILTRGVSKAPMMTLSVSPPTIPLGSHITSHVHAQPLVDKPVAVVFRGPNGEEVIKVGETDISYNLDIDFYPTSVGQWTARARFMGDRQYAGAKSEPVTFIVTDKDGGIVQKTNFKVGYFMGGYLFKKGFPYDSELLYGFRFGWHINQRLQMESEIILSSPFDSAEKHGFLSNFNILADLEFPVPGKIVPFITTGLGYLGFTRFAPSPDLKGWAVFLGGGFKFLLRPNLKGRLELRYLNIFDLDIKPEGHFMILWGADMDF